MKTTGQIARGVAFSSLAFLGILISTPSAVAATIFLDDFEDGDHVGWQVTNGNVGNGSGSTGVELHNTSMMAVVQHSGSGYYSLSQDFSYAPTDTLSFTMHAIANSRTMSGGGILESFSGVTVSFLNVLNGSLGTVSIVNATDPGSFGSTTNLVDTAQHDYMALVSDFAALAGLGASAPIAKINLSFFASSEGFCNVGGCASSSSKVWFDNVTVSDVSAVPVPAAAWLFGSGLLGLIGISRRTKAA